MSESNSKKTKFLASVCVISSITAIAFGALWIQERSQPPKEVVKEVEVPIQVIKEVPVEKIREVPKEVIKEVEVIKRVEVPAKLTVEQQTAVEFTSRYFSAEGTKTLDDALYKIDSVRVGVFLDAAVKTAISEDSVRNKFELVLRRNGVKIDEKAGALLFLNIEGYSEQSVLYYSSGLRLYENVVVIRKGDFRRVFATLWERGSFGNAGSKVVESAILRHTESQAEWFANRYLASQEKVK